ncbi:MAG: hypothetical protein AAF108_04650 [Planctomycetota bacterium]
MEQRISVEQRLDRLERHVRLWKAGCVSVGLVLGLFVTVAATDTLDPDPLIRAHRIEVVGADGRPALSFSSDPDGGAVFVHNSDGDPVIELYADAQRAGHLRVNAPDGTNRVLLTGAGVGGRVGVSSQEGSPVVSVQANQGRASVSLGLPSGEPSVRLAATSAGTGIASFYDASGRPRATIGVGVDQAGALTILNSAGSGVIDAYADERGRGAFRLADGQGRSRVSFQVDDDGGAMYLVNAFDASIFEVYSSSCGNGSVLVSDRDSTPRVRFDAAHPAAAVPAHSALGTTIPGAG